jgi:hypothetical protein
MLFVEISMYNNITKYRPIMDPEEDMLSRSLMPCSKGLNCLRMGHGCPFMHLQPA